jgi:hypothetical protein
MVEPVPLYELEKDRLVCTACLASVGVPCDCGVLHKRMTPGELAKAGVKKWPELSNHVIAERLGISEYIVRKTRDELGALKNAPVAKMQHRPKGRIGKDGKNYPMPQKPEPPKKKVGCDPVLTRDPSVNDALVAVFDYIVSEGWSDHQLALFVHACQKLHARAKGSIQWYDAVQRRRAAKRQLKEK